jgi:hypothetical protein
VEAQPDAGHVLGMAPFSFFCFMKQKRSLSGWRYMKKKSSGKRE